MSLKVEANVLAKTPTVCQQPEQNATPLGHEVAGILARNETLEATTAYQGRA